VKTTSIIEEGKLLSRDGVLGKSEAEAEGKTIRGLDHACWPGGQAISFEKATANV